MKREKEKVWRNEGGNSSDRFFVKFVVVFILPCNEDRVAQTGTSIVNCQSESYADDRVSQIDV